MSLVSFVDALEAQESVAKAAADRPRRRLWPLNRFVTIGAALLLAIAVGDAITISMQRDASIAAYETATSNLARGMSAQTAHLLERIDKLLADVATVSASPENGGERAAASLFERGKAMTELASLAVADAFGRIVAATPGGPAEGTDVSASDLFKTLRASEAPATQIDLAGDSFRLARRLSDSRGRFGGVVLATISTPALRDFYQIAMPPRRAVTLMSDDGAVLVQYPLPQATVARVTHPERLAIDKGACVASFGPDLVDDSAVVAAICRFKDAPFALETTAPAAEALAFWSRERIWLALGGVLAALVVVWLLYVFARQVRRLEISELSLAAKKLQAETAHNQLDVALSNIIQGVCFFDGDHRLIVANLRFRDLYDLPEDVAHPGADLSAIVAAICEFVGLRDIDRESFLASLELVARARSPHASVLELGNGRTIAIQSQPLADGGWVATHEDITERRRAEDKISYLANHDVLTGLVNRTVLTERLGQLVDGAIRHGRIAVLFIDLNLFKAVNDTLGHDVGDTLLQHVAARLKHTAPAHSTIARFGGDEFVILLTGVFDPAEVAGLAQKLIEAVSAPYKVKQHDIVIGASVGIALSKDDPVHADTLLKNADLALYMSKAQGRGVYRFFYPDMESQMRDSCRPESQIGLPLREAV